MPRANVITVNRHHNERAEEELARICAELLRQCIRFTVTTYESEYVVELTGF